MSVIHRQGKPNYYFRWKDPLTRRRREKASDVPVGRDSQRDRSAAARAAGELEKELNEGSFRERSKVTWGELRERYVEEGLGGLKESTIRRVESVFNVFAETTGLSSDSRIIEITADRISRYVAAKRREDAKEATIGCHLRHLKAAFNWAVGVGLMRECPKISPPKRDASRQKMMKGRPLASEEFERMLAIVPQVVGDANVDSWRFYLVGMWWSGLRLAESLDLYWDRDGKLQVIMADEQSMFRIPGELEKGGRDRLLPMAPEFVEFLQAVPKAERRGRVFRPRDRKGQTAAVDVAGKIGVLIGEAAGIVVETDPKTDEKSYASLHDLRRTFGARWARRIMPADLQVLMRHESIDTTLRYYVGRNAETTASVLWSAYRTAGGSTALEYPADAPQTPETTPVR